MKKLVLLIIISFYILPTSTAQTIDSTLLLLDETAITSGVFTADFVIQEEYEVSSTQC